VICGLTSQIADFDPSCDNFEADELAVARKETVALPLNGKDGASIRVDKETLERLKEEQDMNFAIIAGLVASILGAVIWAAITVKSGFQIGYMAIAVGAIVGLSVRYAGKGIDPIYPFIGAGFALFGCILGNFLSLLGYISIELGSTWIGVLDFVNVSELVTFLIDDIQVVDFLFYGIAIYEGYRFAPRSFELPAAVKNI